MTYQEVLENARAVLSKNCKACPVCNGKACGNHIPGPGAKGVGDTAIRNYEKWQDIRVNMDTIHPCVTPDTSLNLFGKTFRYPFFAGPVGAVTVHYSDKYDDMAYNNILVKACADNGIAAFTGDGLNGEVMKVACKAIAASGGTAIPTVKPWNLETIQEKLGYCRESGCFAVAMDIDAAGLPFLKNMNPPAGSKTVEQLAEIAGMVGKPFIVKGIMTVAGALKAKEAGASAIVVSNHGGRPRSGSMRRHRRSPRGYRGRHEGQRREDLRGRRHPQRRGCFQGAGAGRRRSAHLPAFRSHGLRRRRGRREALHREDRRGAERHHGHVRRGESGVHQSGYGACEVTSSAFPLPDTGIRYPGGFSLDSKKKCPFFFLKSMVKYMDFL